MNYIDFHIDTLMKFYKEIKEGTATNKNLWSNNYQVDIERLLKSKYLAQFFACFIFMGEPPINGVSYYDDALGVIDLFHNQINLHTDKVAFAGSYNDYITNKSENKLSAFVTIEEGGILDDKIERLEELYNKGVRAITLTWNFENCIGYPNCKYNYQNKGLKPFGIEVVEKMNELGIIVDVSHLSDGGFYDVYKYSKRPFMATHSNARALCDHSRNLTDDMIKKLAERGGITGLNFCSEFLKKDSKYAYIEDMMKHIRYLMNVGGREIVGIGTDYDGISNEVEIKDAGQMSKLAETMEKYKFTSDEIEAVCYKNQEQFFERYFGK